MNKMTVSGVVKNEPTLNHVARGMEMYAFDMHVERASGVFDMIPCICNKIIMVRLAIGQKLFGKVTLKIYAERSCEIVILTLEI